MSNASARSQQFDKGAKMATERTATANWQEKYQKLSISVNFGTKTGLKLSFWGHLGQFCPFFYILKRPNLTQLAPKRPFQARFCPEIDQNCPFVVFFLPIGCRSPFYGHFYSFIKLLRPCWCIWHVNKPIQQKTSWLKSERFVKNALKGPISLFFHLNRPLMRRRATGRVSVSRL